MTPAATVALLALLAPVSAPRQAARPLPQAAVRLARELAAPTLDRRFQALRTIEASPALLKNPAFGRAIAAALTRDYNPFWTPRQRRHALLGEGFADFYGQVTDLLVTHYSLKDPEILRVLALGAYTPQSRMAHLLAGQGSRVVPYILELSRRGPDYNRPQAIGVFGFLLLRQRAGTLHSPLSPTDRRLAWRIVRRAVRGRDYSARMEAASALGAIGGRTDLPALAAILSGPDCGPAPPHHAICGVARKSMRRIRRRLAARQRRPQRGGRPGR